MILHVHDEGKAMILIQSKQKSLENVKVSKVGWVVKAWQLRRIRVDGFVFVVLLSHKTGRD